MMESIKGGSWIILGATSPVAKAFARELAGRGLHLLVSARDAGELQNLSADFLMRGATSAHAIAGDITDLLVQEQIAHKARELPGPVSVFVATGIMPEQAAMLADAALCGAMMTTNATALMQMTNRLLPLLEDQQAGAVVLLGSVAGDRGRKKNFLYGASKAALAAYAQGLAAHLSGFHVPVLLVKPGILDTAMTWGLKTPPVPLGQPEGLASAILKRLRHGAKAGGSLYYPFFWWGIMMLIRHLPTKIFNKLNF